MIKRFIIQVIVQIKGVGCLTDVVHSPERFKTRREKSSDKEIITVSIALILLGRIVHTRVSGVLGRILLLANQSTF